MNACQIDTCIICAQVGVVALTCTVATSENWEMLAIVVGLQTRVGRAWIVVVALQWISSNEFTTCVAWRIDLLSIDAPSIDTCVVCAILSIVTIYAVVTAFWNGCVNTPVALACVGGAQIRIITICDRDTTVGDRIIVASEKTVIICAV